MYKEQEAKIDQIDKQIIELLGLRYELVREVARLKADTGDNNFRHGRIDEVMTHIEGLAPKHNLDAEFIRHIYTIMIGYSHEIIADMRD